MTPPSRYRENIFLYSLPSVSAVVTDELFVASTAWKVCCKHRPAWFRISVMLVFALVPLVLNRLLLHLNG